MLPARPALHPTADEKAVRLPIRGFPDLGQGRALGPSDQFQDLRALAVGTRGSAKFAADLRDLTVKLVTPGVAVVLLNGAVQKANQVSDIAFGERGPWHLKVFRTAIHSGPSLQSAVASVRTLKNLPGARSAGPFRVPSAREPWHPLQPRSTNRDAPACGDPAGSK
jgi:hypothetical protein